MGTADDRIRALLLGAAVVLLAGVGCRTTDAGRLAAAPPSEKKVWSNAVRWRTASEVDNFGYDVYRSTSPDGPFERLNTEVIEGAGTSDEVHAYRYVDAAIDPYTTYYYYVESISMSGVRERFTPVGEAPAKIPARQEAED